MNAAANIFGQVQVTEQLCPQHNEPMHAILGHMVCKTCAAIKREQDEINHAKALKKSICEKHFAGAMMPERHTQSGFKNYIEHSAAHRNFKAVMVAFAKAAMAGSGSNALIAGRTGTGKTHLACAVANNLLNAGKFVRYATSEAMASDIAAAWSRPDDSEQNAIHRYTEYDLLILDEYGLHDQHEKRLELVHKVLYARYDAMKPTMLISNMCMAELKENLGDRLWSRFNHGGITSFECNWADARVVA